MKRIPSHQDYDLDSEYSDEGKGGRGIRSSVSLEIYGLQREQPVYFSNQEYYRRLEELKSAHLRNMAELERMYISQDKERHGEEEDRALGRGRNREGRQPIRLKAAVYIYCTQEDEAPPINHNNTAREKEN